MSDLLQEPISVLCDEVAVPTPKADADGVYHLVIDGQQVRVFSLKQGKVVLAGVIGSAAIIAEDRKESRQSLLASCLALQAVRFGKLATQEVLTLEPETGELVLWQSFEGPGVSVPVFLAAAESLLNELEFWKTWLGAA